MSKDERSGQILVIFAVGLVVFLGFAALVVDIGLNYSFERRYQAVADAASLAGAQELQPATRSTPVSAAMQTNARTRALEAVLDEMAGGATSTCDPTADIVDCDLPGGDYRVSILTPSPTCVTCTPDRAVQVTVTQPNFSTTFARLLGQTEWTLSRTSVAGLSFGKSYTIVALRPPQPIGSSSGFDVRDIRIEGNTRVHVINGDVGTNANMEYGGYPGSKLILDSGYKMFYFDPYHGPQWSTPPDPPANKVGAMIADPGYVIPTSAGLPAGSVDTNEAAGSACLAAATSLATSASYSPYMPTTGPGVPDMSRVTCMNNGLYTEDPGKPPGISEFLNGDVTILYPGLYYFEDGLTAQGTMIGGYTADQPGVALVVPQTKELNVNVGGGGSLPTAISLNAGSKLNNPAGQEANAALDVSGNPIVTNTDPPIKLTLMVTLDTRCTVSTPYPLACGDGANDAIKIAGSSTLYLAGVQYMPSDNSSINSSAATGYIGQIWAWTLKYSGGVLLTQEGVVSDEAGIMRIDTACSPGTACN